MKFFPKLLFFSVSLLFTTSCSSDDDANDQNGDNGNGGTEQSCDNMPQFANEQHQQAFSMIGSSCLTTSLYDHNQVGSATMVESDGSPECMIDTAFYKIHMGHADFDDYTKTFDVDVYMLTVDPINVGDEIDLSANTVNAYYTYTQNNVIKTAKITGGTLKVEAASDADFGGEFSFNASEFEVGSGIDAFVVGSGSFVTGGDEVVASGRFLLQDHGLSPDCQ
ncbi:MAG: hypothetical protein LAT54_04790 [Cryomorphaceae bacterium]|nr:hypothetical protein [Cryomorphaceae bacterium]